MLNRKILIAVHAFALCVVVTLFILSFAVTGMAAPALSNSGGGSWQYSKEITISDSGGTLSDYQVLVQLSGSNFPANARPDGADIRFTDAGGNELSYWVEKWDYAGKSAKIWVKVPNIAGGGGAAIRMYYGNSMAVSVSNGDATFIFFDDFSSSSINSNKWNVYGSSTISSGELRITSSTTWNTSGITSKGTFALPLVIEDDMTLDGDQTYVMLGYSNDPLDHSVGVQLFPHWDKGNTIQIRVDNSPTEYAYTYSTAKKPAKLVFKNPGYDVYYDNQLLQSSSSWNDNNKRITINQYNIGSNHDNIRVRKYTSSEPIVTLGAEQPPTTVPPTTVPPTTVPPTTVPPTTVPPTTVPPTTVPPTTVPPTTVPPTPTTTQTAEPESSAVLLHGEKTEVVLGEDVLLKLSAVNLIANPPMNVQVILYPPSGMSVTSSEFVKSGAGIYTTTYSLAPSEGKDIEVRIKTNQVGDFNVKGRIVYYFGDNKSSVEDHTLNLPIKVRKEVAPAQNEGTPAQKQTPGFDVITGVSGLLLSILLIRAISKLCLKN